jgi:hypothetical protein
VAQHVGPVGDCERHVDVSSHEHDRGPDVVGDLLEYAQHALDDHRRQTEAHLFDQQEPWPACQRPPEGEHLLLAT